MAMPEEVAAFRRHMAANPATGAWAMAMVDRGAPLVLDAVAGSDAIGELMTFFKNIGGAISLERSGHLRFRVREAVGLFELPKYEGDRAMSEMWNKVLRYRQLFNGPDSKPIVTLAQFSDGLVVLDGNHTTMAAYLHAIDHSPGAYALPAYVLTLPEPTSILG